MSRRVVFRKVRVKEDIKTEETIFFYKPILNCTFRQESKMEFTLRFLKYIFTNPNFYSTNNSQNCNLPKISTFYIRRTKAKQISCSLALKVSWFLKNLELNVSALESEFEINVSDAEPVLGSPPPINTGDNSRFCTHLICRKCARLFNQVLYERNLAYVEVRVQAR